MRIGIFTVGSQGDVLPQAALGEGLVRAGHRVTLVSLETFRELAHTCGLEFAPVDIDPYAFLRGDIGQSWMSSKNSPLRLLRGVSKAAAQFLSRMNDEALRACNGCEAIIYTVPLSISGQTIAEALGVPGIATAVAPYHPTSEFSSVFVPTLPFTGKVPNRISSGVAIQIFWTMMRSHINRWRKTQPQLGPLPRPHPLRAMSKAGTPWLYGISPSVIPTPHDWPASAVICGYWFMPASTTWKPPESLVRFLESGPAPVYVGFGSMVGANPLETARIVIQALEKSGQRGIIASGWGGLENEAHSDTIYTIDQVPHEWLFPQLAAVVHHGGAGTTAAALRAGVPSLVVPYFYDQYFWAQRVYSLGVGARPIPSRELTVENLSESLGRMIVDQGVRDKCRSLAQSIQSENGVERAVSEIEGYLRKLNR